MDHDGVKQEGFANEALAAFQPRLSIPIIWRYTEKWNILPMFLLLAKADAGLAASIFHFNEISIPDLKRFLDKDGIRVRL